MSKTVSVALLIFLTCFSLLTVCGQTVAQSNDDWAMFQHDSALSGCSNSNPTTTPLNRWNDTAASFGLAVVSGSIYFLARHNSQNLTLNCVDTSTGKLVWSSNTTGESNYYGITPAVQNGIVYTNSAAYNASTGNLIMDYSSYGGSTSPTVSEGLIYMGQGVNIFAPGCVFAINADTGALVWNLTKGTGPFNNFALVERPVAVFNGVAYFSSGAGVYAVNSKTGNTIWHYPVAESEFMASAAGAITATNDSVLVLIGRQLYCLDAQKGHLVWNQTAVGVPAVADGVVYAGGSAFNKSTGATLWSINEEFLSAPAIAGGVVYYSRFFSSNEGSHGNYIKHELLGVNVSSGKIEWTYTLPGTTSSMDTGYLAIANQTLFVSEPAMIIAFNLTPQITSQISENEATLQITIIAAVAVAAIITITVLVLWQKHGKTK